MYCTTALISPSEAAAPPLGGMAPLPLMALAVRASTPAEIRGAHAALSPNLGALATPAAWQAAQTWPYNAGEAPPAAAGVAPAAGAAVLLAAASAATTSADGAAAAAGAEAAEAAAGAAGSANLPPAAA